MPWSWTNYCCVPGCGNKAEKKGRCHFHLAEKRRHEDAYRPSPADRGYDSEWRRIAKAFLRVHRGCYVCGHPAKDVDHVVPLRMGGTNDWDNLQALCRQHHAEKTAAQRSVK